MIRNFENQDIEFLQQQDFVASLELQYHKDVVPSSAVTATDSSGKCRGILYLKEHFTFSAKHSELQRIVPCIFTEDDGCFSELLEYAKAWCDERAALYPDKRVCLSAWVNDDEHAVQQLYMKSGFMAYSVCPCLGYDLTGGIEKCEVPEGMLIRKIEFAPEDVDRYIAATALANDGDSDSANELWFMQGGGSYSIYALTENGNIASSASSWKITDEQAAIENIFSTPDYRRRGLVRTIILHTLEMIKSDGYKLATLGMQGRNLAAMKLYESLGFTLQYNQIEMVYLPTQNRK